MPPKEMGRYDLPYPGTTLVVSMGSITEFQGDVIVNSANPGCIGGGGVDGAIVKAGGLNLARDRYRLPILRTDRRGREIRCEIGSAVLTGPNDYGSLPSIIIHAVGPNFNLYRDLAGAATLLKSAYIMSLNILYKVVIPAAGLKTTTTRINNDKNNNHKLPPGTTTATTASSTTATTTTRRLVVGFSLLSAGVFRGPLQLEEVLYIAIESIRDWFKKVYHHECKYMNDNNNSNGSVKPLLPIQEIHLFGFTPEECHALNNVCKVLLGKNQLVPTPPSQRPTKQLSAAQH